jgi:hypothetical protein
MKRRFARLIFGKGKAHRVRSFGAESFLLLATGARVNLINNVFIPGPQSADTQGCILPEDPAKETQVYLEVNVGPFTPSGAEDQWLNVTFYEPLDGQWVEHRPAPESFRADDLRVIAEVRERTGQVGRGPQ